MPIALNTSAPGFDLAMELLITLPLVPSYARCSDLREDFGISQSKINELVVKLNRRGYPVVINNAGDGTGRLVAIHEHGWKRAKREGEAYWQKVYGQSASDS